MKRENIVKKLEKEGYKVELGKFSYWDHIPYVRNTAIAEILYRFGAAVINTDLKYADVTAAIEGKFSSVGEYIKYRETGVDMRRYFNFEDEA